MDALERHITHQDDAVREGLNSLNTKMDVLQNHISNSQGAKTATQNLVSWSLLWLSCFGGVITYVVLHLLGAR